MDTHNDMNQKFAARRSFLEGASALTSAALGNTTIAMASEPPPEIKRIRFFAGPAFCNAPEYVAEEFLRLEGFSEIEFVVQGRVRGAAAVAEGIIDIEGWDIPATLTLLDAGKPLVVLAGIHAGCWQLIGIDRIRNIRDLRGKRVAIRAFGAGDHVMLSSILAYVGMDPRSDVQWIAGTNVTDTLTQFLNGKVDAFMAFEPQGNELQGSKIGHVILDTAQDRPWSQYFCCVMVAHREFVRTYPIATKRVLRAYMKATDVCAREPERVARILAAKGIEQRQEKTVRILKSLPFDRWRESNPEDSMRFYALRLHEGGLIRSTPERLIAQSVDWRHLNMLKRELKG